MKQILPENGAFSLIEIRNGIFFVYNEIIRRKVRLSPPSQHTVTFQRPQIQNGSNENQGDHLFVIFLFFFLDFVAYWSLNEGHPHGPLISAHAPKPHSIGLPLYFKTNSLRFSLINRRKKTKYFIFQQKKPVIETLDDDVTLKYVFLQKMRFFSSKFSLL